MRRQVKLHEQVYNYLYPKPSMNDPPDFQAFLHRHLIQEVRIETQRFHGSLNSLEARYPGLNYAFEPHQRRLKSLPYHSRLLQAFSALSLTDHEINLLCRWEGTLWARRKFEQNQRVKVKDTTGLDIVPASQCTTLASSSEGRNSSLAGSQLSINQRTGDNCSLPWKDSNSTSTYSQNDARSEEGEATLIADVNVISPLHRPSSRIPRNVPSLNDASSSNLVSLLLEQLIREQQLDSTRISFVS